MDGTVTTQKSIERLARFMGWTVKIDTNSKRRYVDFPRGMTVRGYEQAILGFGWDPFTRLDDAMMVAEKIGGLHLRQTKFGGWDAVFYWNGPGIRIAHQAKDLQDKPASAITLAALAYLDATEKNK